MTSSISLSSSMTVSDRNSIYSSSDITADTSVEIDSSSTIATDGVTTLTDQQQQQTRNEGGAVSRSLPKATAQHSIESRSNKKMLLYSVDENPPWHLSFLLAFQHYLTMIGGTIAVPFILTQAMCVQETDPARSDIVSTVIFISGIVTLLQCSIGVRLPIVQGTTFSFLVPTFAILSLPEWKCPSVEAMTNMTYEDKTELWQLRMREIQGAIIVASLFQIAMGMFGIVGLILRFITPLTIAPSIAMVGISLFGAAGDAAGKHWGISSLTIVLMLLFSQYLSKLKVPLPMYSRRQSAVDGGQWIVKRLGMFSLLPVLLSIVFVWGLCAILTATDVLAKDSPARTDTKMQILIEAPWFRFPYPGQWGVPTVSLAAVFGMLAGVLAGAIESIGDYYACARLAGAKPPPVHAINRGIAIEGFGCLLAGLWGTGNGTTSFSQNIGAIGLTKVGSRHVIQVMACMLIFFGVLSKFGALFITIPEPIMGGMFCVMFGMIAATGLSNVQFVDLNSSRNLVVLGFSIFFSLVLSEWMNKHQGAIDTGSQIADQIIAVLLSTSMFTAGVLGFVLDNTIPGTAEERGLTKWSQHISTAADDAAIDNREMGNAAISGDIIQNQYLDHHHQYCTYDIPYVTAWLKRRSWTNPFPFLPSYNADRNNCCSPSSSCDK